ncbi:MAG: alcohol dehydrogenase [Rhodoferax sp.]|nr:alcohol dehydrogenase [Rhodoferax sp.]
MSIWAVVENGAPLKRIERPAQEPVGTEVLLDVTYAGVCHSDLHFWKGHYDMGGGKLMKLTDRGVVLPRAPGHEVVGRVARLGPDAKGVKVGDQRIVFPWLGCGVCEVCRSGNDNLCAKPNAIGVMRDGGFGDQVLVPDARFLVDPGEVDPAYAATLACSGVTAYSAIRKVLPMAPDEPIVLFGAGGLGLAAIAMLKALDHRHIVSVDISADKRAAALEMGATQAVDGAQPELGAAILAATGGQVGAVIDFVNIGSTAQTGLDLLKKGGKLILVGVGGGEIMLSLAGMIFRPRTIQGTATGNPQDLRDVTALARSGKLAPIPVTEMPKDQANEALQMLNDGRVKGRIVLVS